jgi:hypothetical protein
VIACVPSLDEIAREPTLAHGLAPEARALLLARCAAALAALSASLTVGEERPAAPTRSGTGPEDGRLGRIVPTADFSLDADEAAAMLRKPRRWLFENAERLPFVRRISKKTLLCSESGLKRWVQAQRPLIHS